MRISVTVRILAVLGLTLSVTASRHVAIAQSLHPHAVARVPLILAAADGERRIRRVMGGALAIIKVDRLNGGSPELMMGYEELPAGQAIQAHHHPSMDEIIFVHRGNGAAELGDRKSTVVAGSTIFIPVGTRVMLRNTGSEPLAIAYFFSHPGYEEYLRDTSVPDGQQATPLSTDELARIRERHKAHIVFDPQ
jgi:quercetin dioxygenase-like cupin family protein